MSLPDSNSGMYRFVNMGPPPSVPPGPSRSRNSDSFVQFGPIDYTPQPSRQNADKKALPKGPKVDQARRASARAPRASSHRKDLHDTASPSASTSTSASRPRSESNPNPYSSVTRDGVARFLQCMQSSSSDSSPEAEAVEIESSDSFQDPHTARYANLSRRELEEIDAKIAAKYRKRHRQRVKELARMLEKEKDPQKKQELQDSWDSYIEGMERMDELRRSHGRPPFIGPER